MGKAHLNIDALRQALMDYYGTAMAAGIGPAVMNLTEVELADPEELVRIAQREHFNLDNYISNKI